MGKVELNTFPDNKLRTKTEQVVEFDRSLKELADNMAKLMYSEQGIGLAAPQAGFNVSIIVVDIGDGKEIFINPEITESSREKDVMVEGCLSLPGISVKVSRPEVVKVKAMNLDGDIFYGEYSGLLARVIQHEIDHLTGKLLIDYLDPFRKYVSVLKLKRQKKHS